MKKGKYILVIVSIFFITLFTKSGEILAHVEKTYFLQGKVGDRNIFVKIQCYDEFSNRNMFYFFEDEKKDQFFKGVFHGETWRFSPEINNSENNSESVITEKKNGCWTGYWQDNTGKYFNIELKPIGEIPKSSFTYLSAQKELDPYESYKFSLIHLYKVKTEKRTKDLSIDWYKENESGISFFRLRDPSKNTNRDSLNLALENIQLSLIQEDLHFDADKKNNTIKTEILFLNQQLISFKISRTTIFKTKNPYISQQLQTLDLHNARQIGLEEILWFGKKTEKLAPEDIQNIYEYRKAIFAPKLFSILKALYPDKMKMDTCELNKIETWTVPSFALTKKGIALGFFAPGACSILDWAIVPFKNLTPYLEKKYRLISL